MILIIYILFWITLSALSLIDTGVELIQRRSDDLSGPRRVATSDCWPALLLGIATFMRLPNDMSCLPEKLSIRSAENFACGVEAELFKIRCSSFCLDKKNPQWYVSSFSTTFAPCGELLRTCAPRGVGTCLRNGSGSMIQIDLRQLNIFD